MKTLAALLLIALAGPAHANMILAPPPSGAAYTGSGDAVSGASFYGGIFAYSAATRGTNAVQLCNVSDVACADVVSDATTGIVPNTPVIGGVTCGTAVGVDVCTVKIIYDKTSTIGDLTQTAIGSRASFKPSCVGSIPCMQSTGFAFYAGGTFGQAAFTFSYGGTLTAAGGGNRRMMASNSVPLIGTNGTPVSIMYAGAFANGATTLSLGQFYTHVGTVDSSGGGAQAIFLNGTSDGTGTGGTTAASGSVSVFADTTGGNGTNGDSMEFRIDVGVMSGGNITALDANMRSRGGY